MIERGQIGRDEQEGGEVRPTDIVLEQGKRSARGHCGSRGVLAHGDGSRRLLKHLRQAGIVDTIEELRAPEGGGGGGGGMTMP